MSSVLSIRRDQPRFAWRVACGIQALGYLAGVRYDLLFRDAEAIVTAFRKGSPAMRAMFGPDVELPKPCWAPINYGHLNTLGCPLAFPENSEVGVQPICASIREGIELLSRSIEFTSSGLYPFYLELHETLRRAMPDQGVIFGNFKAEGPITTAWLLRGQGFFTDLFDEPELVDRYLHLVTDSVVKYKLLGRSDDASSSTDPVGVADDGAAMIPPRLWPRFVVLHLDRYYRLQGRGPRRAHIENLVSEHLPFLDELRLSHYDPSVSPSLTPALIRDNCHVRFQWRLNSTHYPAMTVEQIERWVYEAVADGACAVATDIEPWMCNEPNVKKVHAFIEAAKRVGRWLEAGRAPEDLTERIA